MSVRNIPFEESHAVQNDELNTHVVHDSSHSEGELVRRQTQAVATLTGEHPGFTPEARTTGMHRAVIWFDTHPVEKDKPLLTRSTRPVDINSTVACLDAVRHVEGDSTTCTLLTDSPVGNGAVLWCTPRAVLEDNIFVAFDALLGVAATARRADG